MPFETHGIEGPDVSFYQAQRDQNGRVIAYIDFDKMKEKGVSFVIIRAGQNTWIDPDFRHNWAEAKRVGIPRAPYFFLDYRSEGTAQAEKFWSYIQDDPGEGPLIVDFETGSGTWKNHLEDFITRLQVLSGYSPDRIWVYTGHFYWMDYGPQTEAERRWFISYGLWLARYSSSLDPDETPQPWGIDGLNMWQRGTTIVYGPDYGVHSLELDWNTFNGDWEKFKQYWIVGEPEPPPDPDEGGNVIYKVVWSRGVARRTAPHIGTPTQNTYTGLVYDYPMEVEVVEENIPDAINPSDPEKVWVKFSDGHYGASKYPDSMGIPRDRMVKVVEPEPEPEPPCVNESFVLKVDGFKEVSGTLECE